MRRWAAAVAAVAAVAAAGAWATGVLPTDPPSASTSPSPSAASEPDAGAPGAAPLRDPARVDLDEIRPSVRAAGGDRGPIYDDGCHVAPEEVESPPDCVYGDEDGERVVVAVGDSHMAHWWAALDEAARRSGARLVWFTKSGCSATDVTVLYQGRAYTECDEWRRSVGEAVRDLPRVDVVVLASSYGKLLVRRDGGGRVQPAAAEAEWRDGTRRAVELLTPPGVPAVVVRDTPGMGTDQPACLRDRDGDAAACSVPRSTALRPGPWRAERAVAAADPQRISTLDLTDDICGPERCYPVTADGVLRWRDRHHLTSTFAITLAPRFEVALRPYLD